MRALVFERCDKVQDHLLVVDHHLHNEIYWKNEREERYNIETGYKRSKKNR